MRKGTLTDAETLRLYEHGAAMIALCVKEGMTPYGIISRISRARKHRAEGVRGDGYRLRVRPPRKLVRQPTFDSFDALRAAVDALERQTAELGATPRRRRAA